MPDQQVVGLSGLDILLASELIEGKILEDIGVGDGEEDTIHYDVRAIRDAIKDINEVYSNPKSTKKDFVEVIEKHRRRRDSDIQNFLDTLSLSEGKKLLKVVKRKDTKDGFTVTFKKISDKEHGDIVKNVAEKLMKKLKPEQIKVLLQEGLRKISDVEELKKASKELDKDDPVIKEKRGCFYLEINDVELHLIS